jgi:hypothetical protein
VSHSSASPFGDIGRQFMSHLIDLLVAAPTLPGTVLLGVCLAYWIMLIVGAVDLHVLHVDLDLHVDADATPDASPDTGHGGWGLVAFRFLNINEVPFMIWLSFFAMSYVVVAAAAIMVRPVVNEFGEIAAVIACTTAVALLATKALTQPLRGKFDTIEPNVADTLIGRTCVITTLEVSERFGQARLESNGAPLLLNVRGVPGTLSKNDVAIIVDYDRDLNVFHVEPVAAVPSESLTREAV